jgi:hypothetical protein
MTIVRTRDPNLSLWQSAVAQVVLETSAKNGLPLSQNALLDHPMVRATNDVVRAHEDRQQLLFSADQLTDEHTRNTHLSSLCFEIAQAQAQGLEDLEAQLLGSYWPFSDKDPNFLRCVAVYAYYKAAYKGHFLYNDWQKEGGGSLQYGVIDWRIPNDARIGIIGDWGTGMDDSIALLRDLMVNHSPAAIIHLGDINAPITRRLRQARVPARRAPTIRVVGLTRATLPAGRGSLPTPVRCAEAPGGCRTLLDVMEALHFPLRATGRWRRCSVVNRQGRARMRRRARRAGMSSTHGRDVGCREVSKCGTSKSFRPSTVTRRSPWLRSSASPSSLRTSARSSGSVTTGT